MKGTKFTVSEMQEEQVSKQDDWQILLRGWSGSIPTTSLLLLGMVLSPVLSLCWVWPVAQALQQGAVTCTPLL